MKQHNRKAASNQLRIIGGQWRSRKLAFADAAGLRPTADRIRETLFNWLAPDIHGAQVLDVFSGSGALLFEAMSRGAAKGLALEQNPKASSCIQQGLQLLQCEHAEVICTDALRYLAGNASQRFDIVFVDPPFHQNLLEPSCHLLENNGWLADNALIYLESELSANQHQLPNNWQPLREKSSPQLYYSLWQRQS